MIRRGALLLAATLCAVAQEKIPARRLSTLTPVSDFTPYAANCNGIQNGHLFRHAAVEPWLAVDPRDPFHLVGVWQQDRWSNGGASGLLAAVSRDGGRSWKQSIPPFSTCASAANRFVRASDPWVSISPDGTVHFISLSLNGPNNSHALLASRSTDGGLTWSTPITLRQDQGADILNDKESLTADPHDAHYVYAVWDRLAGLTATAAASFRGPTWFARSSDGGATWEPARQIFDPGANAQTIANQIVVLPDGTLVNGFVWIQNATAPLVRDERLQIAISRSPDRGLTWSPPIVVSAIQPAGVSNVKTGIPVRSGALIPALTVDPVSGATYCAWQDGRFSAGQREGIAFSRSTDGGLHWSTPAQINQVPEVQAFTPALAASPDGRLAVTYYDFRKDTDDKATLLTSYWRLISADGGQSWAEAPLSDPFDLTAAAVTDGSGYFIGDYQGLAAAAGGFVAVFAVAGRGEIPSAVYATANPSGTDRTSNGRTEINRHVLRRHVQKAKRK